MKLINYKCRDCEYQQEDLFSSEEKIPYILKTYCPMCGGILEQFNFKNNSQRVFINDPKVK